MCLHKKSDQHKTSHDRQSSHYWLVAMTVIQSPCQQEAEGLATFTKFVNKDSTSLCE